jgi:two-component system chemotaxis sensor kinase CheA
MDPMESIKITYFEECAELLVAMEEGIIAMENGEADDEIINAVFRAVHSIKGGGGAFGFEALVSFAHIFETVLDRIRSGELVPEPDVIKCLLRAGDLISDHVNAARNGSDGGIDDEEVKDELRELSGDASEEAGAEDFEGLDFAPMQFDFGDSGPEAKAESAWSVHFAPRASLYSKANEPYLILRELAALGDMTVEADLSRLPPLSSLEPEEAYIAWNIVLRGDITRAAIEEAFEFAAEDCDLVIELLPQDNDDLPELPQLPDLPEPVNPAIPDLSDSTAAAAMSAGEAIADTPKTSEPQKELASETSQKAAAVQSIRVDPDKVDRLVNLAGELVITQAMLAQSVQEAGLRSTSKLGAGLVEFEHLLRELQESVMAIRTQPVKSVFQRMPRLVRELAVQTGKQVRLVVEGESTEVDKTVIDRIGEPLTHMIRNAIDHGLEPTEARIAAGKPAEGTVTLSAEHRSGRIVIEIADDGAGINRVRVRDKAIEKGLIPASAVLSDEETDNLIFMPGFSTASTISNISGRGVGMDVVRRSIVELGGRISIVSTPGSGSRFVLTLPLTLAVLDGMVVAVGDQTYVLPLSHIIESMKLGKSDIHSYGREWELLDVRGSFVPVVRIGNLLGIEGSCHKDANGVAILVESESTGRFAVIVDAILGQRQVVIKSFENNYRHIEGVAAATILGNGRVALILDIDGLALLRRAQRESAKPVELKATGS